MAKLIGIDMHKNNKSNVAEIGGLPVLVTFLIGVFLYLGIRTFFFLTTTGNTELLAAILTITLIAIIGLVDDMLGWKIGLRQWQKPILCMGAALPMMMINAGTSTMAIPFFGNINFGFFYPLIIVPLIITASANAFNMVAGYNGLEAGLGIIMLSALGFVVWFVQGLGFFAMLAAILIVALLGFLFFNWYPAKVFPGDTLTYMVGATLGVIAILGNAEKALLILFFPYVLQFFIKSRHGWQKQSFGEINQNENIQIPKKFNALEHVAIKLVSIIKRRVKEYEVVFTLYCFELVMVVFLLLLL